MTNCLSVKATGKVLKTVVLSPGRTFWSSSGFTLPPGKVEILAVNRAQAFFKMSLHGLDISYTAPPDINSVYFLSKAYVRTRIQIWCPSGACEGLALVSWSPLVTIK